MGWVAARAAWAAGAVAAAAAVAPVPAPAQEPVPLVRVAFPADDGSLTPYTFGVGYPLVTLLYDTLTWRDAEGRPRPWLARSVRREPGGLTVTVRLRRGARWHDGRPVTARDVAFTYRHVADRAHPRFTPQVADIASVTPTGRRAVRFRLRRPSLGLPDQPFADVPILPRHLWARVPPGRLAPAGFPVGSGPYRLVRHDPDRRYVFEAVDDYFRGRPAVRRLEVAIIPRADRMVTALQTGRVDAIPVGPDARQLTAPGIEVLTRPGYTGTVLMLNSQAPPFDRGPVRRAVSRALDLQRIAGAAGAEPADRGYVSPASPWAASETLHRHDPAAARVAFAELGVPPFSVLASDNNPVALDAARQVVAALERAGARVRLEERDADALAEAVGQDDARPAFQAAIWTAPALASHDPAFLRALFGSSGLANLSGYRSRRFDAAAERVAAARTGPERREAAEQQLAILARELPVVPLAYAPLAYAYRSGAFDGWRLMAGTGILDKRSFVADTGDPAPAPPAAARGPAGDPLDRTPQDGSLLPYLLGAAGLLALGGAAVAVRRRGGR